MSTPEKAQRQREPQLEQEKEQEKQKRNEYGSLLAPTNYASYLSLCHDMLFLPLAAQKNSDLASAHGGSNVVDKYYPLRLQPWGGFPSLHAECQERLAAGLGEGKHFRPAYAVDMTRKLFADGPVADKEDIGRFHFFAVEAGTREVIDKYLLIQEQAAPTEAKHELPKRIRFLNNPHGLLSIGQLKEEEARTMVTKPVMKKNSESRGRTAASRKDGDDGPLAKREPSPQPELHPDQWCFRVDSNGALEEDDVHVPIFVIDYKAAHQMQVSTLQEALATPRTQEDEDGRASSTNGGGLFSDVMRAIYSDTERQLGHAKSTTAQAIAQAFHRMVEFGLCYSYIALGDALLLLHLEPEDPRTLYYHLAVPGKDVGTANKRKRDMQQSAVALVTTMVLLALETSPLTQKWKQDADKVLRKWGKAYIEMGLEQDDTGSSNSSSNSNSNNNSDSNSNFQQRAPGQIADTRLPYCTQVCLLGLRNGGHLDRSCPNVHLHQHGTAFERGGDGRSGDGQQHHVLSARQFAACMHEQLSRDLDDDCEALDRFGKVGATAMLFRLTLRPYGYCLVAKGVQRRHVGRLQHELRIYEEPGVAEQQGVLVPVCLGIVELACDYISYTGAHVTHLLLLSYCGEPLWKKRSLPPVDFANICHRANAAWTRLRKFGIVHGDEREPNAVWNEDLQRVMCIDFGEAQRARAGVRVREDCTSVSASKRQHTGHSASACIREADGCTQKMQRNRKRL